MPRIPTADPSVKLSIGNQPNIPMSFGTAPGKAVQRLGSSIKSLGGKIGGQADQEQEFQNKLSLLKTENGLRENAAKDESSFNIDKDDPNAHRDSRNEALENRFNELRNTYRPTDDRSRYNLELSIERMRGAYRTRHQNFATQQRQTKLVNRTQTAITGEWNKLSQLDPDDPNYAASFNTVREGTDALIDSAPMPDRLKDQLRAGAAKLALETINRLPADKRLPFVQQILNAEKARKASEVTGPEPGVDGPPKAVIPKPYEGRILDKAPSSSQRAAIRRKGGIVINMDTNWAKKSSKNPNARTAPMVVVPDDATPAERNAAMAYATGISNVLKERFGIDVKPSIKTRSQNGRGRSNTMHLEPYAVTDGKAVEFFSSNEGRALHAQILRDTLGKLPGAHFSIPHMPRKGDNGAHGNGTNEVAQARALIGELRKPGSIPGAAPQPEPERVSVGNLVTSALREQLPRLKQVHLEAQRFELKNQLESDLKLVEESGEGLPNIDIATAKKVLEPNQINRYQQLRKVARYKFDLTNGLEELPDAEIGARLKKMVPAKDSDYALKSKAYGQVLRKAMRITEMRQVDPATSVEKSREVLAALATNDPRKVMRARMAAQTRIGIPEPLRSPITKDEASKIILPMLGLKGDAIYPELQKIVPQLQAQYGDLADDALRYIARTLYRDNASREIFQGVIAGIKDTGEVPETEKQRMSQVEEENKLEKLMEPPKLRGNPGGFAIMPSRAPHPDAVKFLLEQSKNEAMLPKLIEMFNKKYGPGAAEMILQPEPKLTKKPQPARPQ